MIKQISSFLTQQLYPDLKSWIPTLYRRYKVTLDKLRAPVFSSPDELLKALKASQVKPGSWVTLECKPSMFGPYLRNHFITPFVGHQTGMRLGPPLIAEHPAMAIIGQATSHLKPVGMYPPIDDDLYQICLYPADSNTCGMIGIIPGIHELINHIPAVSNGKNLSFCGMACNVRGVVRQADPKLLVDIGIPIETFEELRQSGEIWFLDLTADEADVEPHSDTIVTEMWGGLYASGHIEIRDGQVGVDSLVEGMVESMKAGGFAPHVIQNKVRRKEITVYAQGIRAVIDIQAPIFSMHMDADIALQYKENRRRFDAVCQGYLNAIKDVAKNCDADIANPDDLDFSYTNSEKAYTVLKSRGAEQIADPVGIAIRDWHRKRGK